MSSSRIRVLLVDDHAVVREGYRRLLEKHDGIEVIGEASDAASAYQAYKTTRPDVVVMDISMPGRGGIDAIAHLRKWDARASVLVFSMHAGAGYILQAFRAGARGYVTKSSPPELLVSAVKDVALGRIAISPEIAKVLAFDRVQHNASALAQLSPREFEILRMLLAGRPAGEIARALNLSPKTVANYHYAVKSKLGAASDFELFRFGLSHGLVEAVGPAEDECLQHRRHDRQHS